jgi:hypothetical protein
MCTCICIHAYVGVHSRERARESARLPPQKNALALCCALIPALLRTYSWPATPNTYIHVTAAGRRCGNSFRLCAVHGWKADLFGSSGEAACNAPSSVTSIKPSVIRSRRPMCPRKGSTPEAPPDVSAVAPTTTRAAKCCAFHSPREQVRSAAARFCAAFLRGTRRLRSCESRWPEQAIVRMFASPGAAGARIYVREAGVRERSCSVHEVCEGRTSGSRIVACR